MAQELLSDLAALAKNGSTWAGDLKEDVELLVKSMHPARDMKLADWYATFNPEYADNEELADMTLGAFYDALVNGEDIYRVANIGGSDTRLRFLRRSGSRHSMWSFWISGSTA